MRKITDYFKRKVQSGVDTVQDGAAAVTGGVKSAYDATTGAISDTVQGGRNLAADALRTGGDMVGFGGGIAGEVSLIMGGFVPYLILGGLPLQLGEEFSNAVAGWSQSVRGNTPQFIGVRREESAIFFWEHHDMLAIVYDPENPQSDAGGMAQLDEVQLHTLVNKNWRDRVRQEVYANGLMAVQDAKQRYGIALDLPLFDGLKDKESTEPKAAPKP